MGMISWYLAKVVERLGFSGREEWIGAIVFDTTDLEPNVIMSCALNILGS